MKFVYFPSSWVIYNEDALLMYWCIPYCREQKNWKTHKRSLKVVSATFLLVCFVWLKESAFEAIKNISDKIKFFSDIQILWRHQMPKLETWNTFYWITWEVKTVWYWNLASLCNITKENLSKNDVKNMAWKLVSGPF